MENHPCQTDMEIEVVVCGPEKNHAQTWKEKAHGNFCGMRSYHVLIEKVKADADFGDQTWARILRNEMKNWNASYICHNLEKMFDDYIVLEEQKTFGLKVEVWCP